MSSNSGTTTVSTNAGAGNPGFVTKMKGNVTSNWKIIVSGLIFVSFYIASFVTMSNVVGSKDSWNQIKSQYTKINIFVLLGTLAFIIATLMFFQQDPQKAVYFMMVVTGVALGLSFMSLSVAAISR